MEWAIESHSKDYWSFWATWLHGEGLGNGIPYQEEGSATTNPMFSFVSWQDWTWQRGERLWIETSKIGSSVRECLSLARDRFLVGPPPTQCFPLWNPIQE